MGGGHGDDEGEDIINEGVESLCQVGEWIGKERTVGTHLEMPNYLNPVHTHNTSQQIIADIPWATKTLIVTIKTK